MTDSEIIDWIQIHVIEHHRHVTHPIQAPYAIIWIDDTGLKQITYGPNLKCAIRAAILEQNHMVSI